VNSKHGFHIHEYGDCIAPDGASAGGHYNPDKNTHGAPENETHHAGDLGNLITDAKGNAKATFEVKGISINSGHNPILGRGIIIHKNGDDMVSQPTGGAGARIGCGVIGAANR
jgi:superoxide dismutase, Cu-Zn family